MLTQEQTYRGHTISVPSYELPVTLDLVRMHLRNEDLNSDDEYVRHLILGAAAYIERTYGLALLRQTIVETHAALPSGADAPLLLRIAPLVDITSIQYVDTAGATQTWSASEYTSGTFNMSPFIVPKPTYDWPGSLATLPNAVTVTYRAGFSTKAGEVPANIRSALMLLVAHMYENREDSPITLPQASTNLLAPFYRFSI